MSWELHVWHNGKWNLFERSLWWIPNRFNYAWLCHQRKIYRKLGRCTAMVKR